RRAGRSTPSARPSRTAAGVGSASAGSVRPRDRPLELREVAADHAHVERRQDRLLRLAFEQEVEARADERLRIRVPLAEPLEIVRGHRDLVLGARAALTDHDPEPRAVAAPLNRFDVDLGHRSSWGWA